MTDERFTPALGRPEWTGLYDIALRMVTRERRWRAALLARIALQDNETLLDVGCGTGTLAVLLKRAVPTARVIGLDPDPEALAIATAKAQRAGVEIEWRRGFARDAATAADQCDVVVSSLVFHQTPLPEKAAGFQAMHDALKPGGRLCMADYGWQRSGLMRALFRATVQRLDGVADTQPNADGVLPGLMTHGGFVDVAETDIIPTPTGSISIYQARRPLPPGGTA